MEKKITVYAKEVKYKSENGEKTFYSHSSSEVSKKNKNEKVYFNVAVTKRCDKKLPNYNAVITFDVKNSYFITEAVEKNGKVYNNSTLWLDDFDVVEKIEKKITTDDDLPF